MQLACLHPKFVPLGTTALEGALLASFAMATHGANRLMRVYRPLAHPQQRVRERGALLLHVTHAPSLVHNTAVAQQTNLIVQLEQARALRAPVRAQAQTLQAVVLHYNSCRRNRVFKLPAVVRHTGLSGCLGQTLPAWHALQAHRRHSVKKRG